MIPFGLCLQNTTSQQLFLTNNKKYEKTTKWIDKLAMLDSAQYSNMKQFEKYFEKMNVKRLENCLCINKKWKSKWEKWIRTTIVKQKFSSVNIKLYANPKIITLNHVTHKHTYSKKKWKVLENLKGEKKQRREKMNHPVQMEIWEWTQMTIFVVLLTKMPDNVFLRY